MTEHLMEQIDRLIQQRPLSKPVLESYRELVNLMKGVRPLPTEIVLEETLKDIKKEEGFPLFSRENLPVDLEASSKLFTSFLDHLSSSSREDKEGLKKALKYSKDDSGWTDRLLKAILKRDDEALKKIGEEVDLDAGTLSFLAQLALKPSLDAIRNDLSEEANNEHWDYGYCPMCGSEPHMAYLDKSGKRFLHCELCGEEWSYARLKCPFCENQDHQTLGYFQAEEEEGFRVDFCRKCLRYLKTIDKRVLEEAAPLELEYLATIHLDLQANKHGFK